MIDYACIKVKAGDGGNGAGSFMHVKGKRLGKADGGDGGKGGDVYLIATRDLNTLEPFRYVKEYKAANGGNGGAQKRRGVQGEDLKIRVPIGTQVRFSGDQVIRRSGEKEPDDLTARRPDSLDQVFDLVENDQKVLVASGGLGGRGNIHLRDEFGRRPKVGEKGEEGELLEITLELKLIADVGLIGLPNAGKSTLLAALTAADPKIAPYPFTTLEPNLGVLRLSGVQAFRQSRGYEDATDITRLPDSPITRLPRQLVLADIPGLIEGASAGKGLGDLFLRHIERTKILVHLIDVTGEDLWGDYQTIRGELKAYSKELAKKKEIIVLNKIDLIDKDLLDRKVNQFKMRRRKVLLIAAKSGEGTDHLIREILKVY